MKRFMKLLYSLAAKRYEQCIQQNIRNKNELLAGMLRLSRLIILRICLSSLFKIISSLVLFFPEKYVCEINVQWKLHTQRTVLHGKFISGG